jgi:hypothetical protein
MAQESGNKGFNLPAPGGDQSGASTSSPSTQSGTTTQSTGSQMAVTVKSDTSSRDLAIGAGVMVVLLVAFFFAKTAYANWLVGRRVSPRSANAAGWWLFILLSCLASAGIFPLASQATFLSAIFLVPVLVLAGAALVLLLLSSRR